jgi:hypothetical protein
MGKAFYFFKTRRKVNRVRKIGIVVYRLGALCLIFLTGFQSLVAKDSNSFTRGKLELSAIETIVFPSELYTDSLNGAVADLLSHWYYRVDSLLSITSEIKEKKNAVILKQARSFKNKKRGSFSIQRNGSSILIRAWESEGFRNALYTLCHDVLGVRWYWPSSLGLEWVGEVPKYFPDKKWEQIPSFEIRNLYDLDPVFAQRNRLNKGYAFNHNLARIFKPEYQKFFPNAYAQLGDRPNKVKGSTKFDPQPNFVNETAVQIAALAAIKHFKDNPNAVSFSLSPNDNVLFDTGEATQAFLEPLSYFRGKPNFSDITFSFANKVAEIVFEEEGMWETNNGVPRYLCMLAYYWTEQVPQGNLHPRIIPILTSDRAQWHDREYAEQDKDLIKRWSNLNTDKKGTWDYYFGAPYPYPRQFNAQIAESLNYLKAYEFDIFFSQASSLWGLDGPKTWISSQLLWDTEQELEYLLSEFYAEFFGAAAQPMRSFYELAETNRNRFEGKAEWIKYFYDEASIELFSPKILKQMRDYLRHASTLVSNESRFAQRISIVSEAFKITECYAAYHASRKQLLYYIFDLENETSLAPKDLIKNFEVERRKFEYTLSRIVEKETHKQFKKFSKLKQTNPSRLCLLQLLSEGVELDLVTKVRYQKEIALLKDWKERRSQFRSLIVNHALNFDINDSIQRDFLGPKVPSLVDWKMYFRASEHLRIDPILSDGEHSKGLRIEGSDSYMLFSKCQLRRYRSTILEAEIQYKVSPDSRIQFIVGWIDDKGNVISNESIIQLPNGSSESFKTILAPLIAPKNATTAKVTCLIYRQSAGDFLEIKKLNFLSK